MLLPLNPELRCVGNAGPFGNFATRDASHSLVRRRVCEETCKKVYLKRVRKEVRQGEREGGSERKSDQNKTNKNKI